MRRKLAFRFDVKAVDDATGEIEGYASVFGNVDSYGDVVERGAFAKTIREQAGKVPILWQHNPSEPIGVSSEMTEDDHGLKVKGQLNLDTQRGREAYSLIKQGALKGLSIGFNTVKDTVEGGKRKLKELRLWEWSPVTFPANTLAGITGVKGLKAGDFSQAFQEARDKEALWRLRYQIDDALSTVMCDLVNDEETTPEDKLALWADSLDQYKDAMVSWLGRWLELIGTKSATPAEMKAGKVLSAKNKEIVANAVTAIDGAKDALQALLSVAEPSTDTQEGKGAATADGEPDYSTLADLVSDMKRSVGA